MAEATCVAPKTCKAGCGYTEGEALGHLTVVDEAVAPTCTETGLTEGSHCARCDGATVSQEVVDALGHDMAEATCTAPATCTVCGETEGAALGHVWAPAHCETAKTCTVCGETEGEALGHDMAEATCTAPSTCTVCGHTEGEALGHDFGDWVVDGETERRECSRCDETEERPVEIPESAESGEEVESGEGSGEGCMGTVGGIELGFGLMILAGAIISRKKR